MEEFEYQRWKYWTPSYWSRAVPAEEVIADLFSKRVRAYISQEKTRGISLDKLILSGRIYLAKKDLGEEVPSLSSDEMAFINAMDEFRDYYDIVRPDIRLVMDLIKFYCCAFADMSEVVEILRPLEDVANWSNFDYERMPATDDGALYLQIGNAAVKARLSDESTRCILQYFFDDHATGGNDILREQISLDCRKMRQYLPPIFTSERAEPLVNQSCKELVDLRLMRERFCMDAKKARLTSSLVNELQCLDSQIEGAREALLAVAGYPFKECAEAEEVYRDDILHFGPTFRLDVYSSVYDLNLESDFPKYQGRLQRGTLNVLKRSGIDTVRQLLEFGDDLLLVVKGFGKTRLEEVKDFLDYYTDCSCEEMKRFSYKQRFYYF